MIKMTYPTMDAMSYARQYYVNTGCDFYGNKNFWYQSTDIPVPVPAECPCCNKVMSGELTPIIAVNNLMPCEASKDKKDDLLTRSECVVISVYRCASCNSLFTIRSSHKLEAGENDEDGWSCDIEDIHPNNKQLSVFSKDINELSQEFILNYNQTELAEFYGLTEMCGMGYRRALEFLVDAYARRARSDEEIDAGLNLGKKINKYIDNQKIKTLAKKAAWLGNDATHIMRKHPDRDTDDMKKFIQALVAMIDAEFAYEDAATIQR